MTQIDLKTLRAEKLQEEIRLNRAEAQMAELKLAGMMDAERDRQAKGGLNRRLPIVGPIGGMNSEMWIDALEHWEHRDPGKPITVTIDSPGGDVLSGFAVFDTIMRLRRKGHRVTTRGRGTVASMAGILLQAGEERIMDANAQLLIHEISFRTGGKVSEIEDAQKFSKALQERLLGILSERSTLTTRQIATRWKKTDWWLDAQEAVELGFADRIE